LPRSLSAAAGETVALLGEIGERTGRQGQADRLARERERKILDTEIRTVFQGGLHQYLQRFIRENAAVDQAIATQFRFG
jgi:uncharacterized alpha-E superfamily protein